MTQYSLQFTNNTTASWDLVLFVTLPAASGSYALAWHVLPAPPNGQASLTWSDTPYACIGTYNATPAPGVFATSQSIASAANQAWSITNSSGVTELTGPTASFTPGLLEITNATTSNLPAAIAFLASGDGIAPGAVMIPTVIPGTTVQFDPQPQFNVVLYQAIGAGQVITNGATTQLFARRGTRLAASVFASPQPLLFPTGDTHAAVIASTATGAVALTIAYSPS